MDIEKKKVEDKINNEDIYDEQEKFYLILNSIRKIKEIKLEKKRKLSKTQIFLSLTIIILNIVILSLSLIGFDPIVLVLFTVIILIYLYFNE